MPKAFAVLLVISAFGIHPVQAHDVEHEVGRAHGALSVRLFYAEGNPFSFEAYEIYRAGEDIPFQVGRTDADGRIVFLPDRAGNWRIKVFSQDGHGADFEVSSQASGTVDERNETFLQGHSRLVVGISVLFGIFGLWQLFASHRS